MELARQTTVPAAESEDGLYLGQPEAVVLHLQDVQPVTELVITVSFPVMGTEWGWFTQQPKDWSKAAARRRSTEVSLNKCTAEQKQLFQQAKQRDIAEWLKTEAARRASREGRSYESLMRMRWIRTWKDGGRRAKARLVVLGYT